MAGIQRGIGDGGAAGVGFRHPAEGQEVKDADAGWMLMVKVLSRVCNHPGLVWLFDPFR